jgi:hypothetical protein
MAKRRLKIYKYIGTEIPSSDVYKDDRYIFLGERTIDTEEYVTVLIISTVEEDEDGNPATVNWGLFLDEFTMTKAEWNRNYTEDLEWFKQKRRTKASASSAQPASR